MKRFALSVVLTLSGALLIVFSAVAQRQIPQSTSTHENFDIRAGRQRSDASTRLWSFTGTLSGPRRGDAEAVARGFLKDNDNRFGLGSDGVDELRVSRRYRTEHNGLTHVTFQQQINGIDVFQAEYTIHLDRQNAVIVASGELIPRTARAFNLDRPQISAPEALRLGAREVDAEVTGSLRHRAAPAGADERQEFDRVAPFGDNVKARLVYFPLAANELRLAWELLLPMVDTPDIYLIVIDAERGSMLYRFNLTCYDENPLKPHGLVYTKESPRPNTPITSASPPVVERDAVPFRATPFNGANIFEVSDSRYDWWAGEPANNLRSNNVNAYLDRDGTPGQPDQPLLMATDGNFTYPVDLTQAPTTEENQKAAQANLFYWVNRYHDILYSFGFDEGAGNFQSNNFGPNGRGQDAINAEAQDGGGTNNANFSTPPDGSPGRVQMFLWTGSPNRDGDFDQGVIIHELTHGLTNRLIGNATGLRGIQSGGMGEGWSDWFGLTLLANEADDPAAGYPVGQYVTNNYQRGIRRFPYSTSMNIFPLTYKDVATRLEVHAIGEIWCNTLWEMRALFIRRYGFREGQRQSIQLVVDGLKLTPNAPTFLDARNAIIVADRVNNSGANQCLIWQAFARRGSGFSANTDDANDGAPVEAFDVAPYCNPTASLHLDKKNYVSGELVRISLSDQNAAGTIAVQVTSSVTGDRETLVLTPETGVDGNFLGTMRIEGSTARPGDRTLQGVAGNGDQIVVTYDDPNGSGGSPTQVSVSAAMTREKVLFEDNVEVGNQGWISTGWTITSTRSASSTRSWTDSPAGNYVNGSGSSLTSPLIDFSGLDEVALTIAHSHQIENRFDLGVVEYSSDDGETWARAANFTGTQVEFKQSRISLRGLNGQARSRIRFRLLADVTGTADGWYIDDIRLTARSSNPASIPGILAPVVSSLSPAFGPPAGGTRVTITGMNFTEDETTSVTFDGISATAVSVLSGSTMIVTAPAHATGPVNVHVVNRNGAVAVAGAYTYYTTGSGGPVPTLSTIFPSSGSTRGGTPVTVIGSGFTPGTEVSFGALKGTVTFINATTLRAVTPAAAAGAVNVTVENGANHATLSGAFSYVSTSPPTVQILSPNGGETYFARSLVNIRWSSSDNRALVRHRVALVRELGPGLESVTDIATDLPGSDQSFAWTVPNLAPMVRARIRVTAVDDEGAETTAFSASLFSVLMRWETFAFLPAALQRLQAASDGKFIYALGGRTTDVNSSTVATLQRLDPAPSMGLPGWSSTDLMPMPTGLNGGEAGFLKGKIYVPGGFSAAGAISAPHLAYDVAANTWTMPAQPPSAASLYSLAVDEPREVFYVTGGSGTSVSTTAARAYDPMTNAWSDLTPMGTARSGHESAVIEGKLYVAGGQGTSSGLDTGEVYDFGSKQWSPIARLNRQRAFSVNVVSKDPAGNPLWFVIGGIDLITGLPAVTEVYDVRNNRWIIPDNSFQPSVSRTNMAGATLGEYFYAIGGSIPNVSVPVNERMRIDAVTALPLDVAPVIAVPAAQIAVANAELKFTVTANDLASGVPITISAEGLPAGSNFTTTSSTNNSVNGHFSWMPPAALAGQSFPIRFTATDGQLSDTKVVVVQVVNASHLVAINAANFRAGPVAAESIVAAFGTNLAVRSDSTQVFPLPLELSGTVVTVDGIPAPLFYVSSDQINFVIPASVDLGPATVIVRNPNGAYALGIVEIVQSAPSIFSADATGNGDAAAQATPDGINYQTPPFEVIVDGKPNILILYGTGIRRAVAANPNDDNGVAESCSIMIGGQQAQVLFAGTQGFFTGLDQLNVVFPASLAGTGPRRVEVVLSINGIEANRVTVMIK